MDKLDLDSKGFEVLEAIYECGGEATTTEVKEYTNIEKNAVIHYRFEKLEEQEMVEMGTGEASGNRVPPKKAILTEEAGERIAGGLFAEDEPSIVERMDRLERQFENVVEGFHELQDEFRNWRYDEETDEEVDVAAILERLDAFEALLEGHDVDSLDSVFQLEERVEENSKVARTKAKYIHRERAFDRNPGMHGEAYVEGKDVTMAVRELTTEIDQIVEALETAGIGPVEDDEFLARKDGLWDATMADESDWEDEDEGGW